MTKLTGELLMVLGKLMIFLRQFKKLIKLRGKIMVIEA